jgi:putative FmdB family regulatory protein
MLIFEYQCESCSSVFELMNGTSLAKCMSCDSSDVKRVKSTIFAPNKNFCPKKKKQVKKDIRSSLLDLLGESDGKCYDKCN